MGRRGTRGVARIVLGAAGVVLACAGPAAAAGGLPEVASGPRPGPDVLYAPAPRAPQLENTGPWKADPILVSGASAYRAGEFLWVSCAPKLDVQSDGPLDARIACPPVQLGFPVAQLPEPPPVPHPPALPARSEAALRPGDREDHRRAPLPHVHAEARR